MKKEVGRFLLISINVLLSWLSKFKIKLEMLNSKIIVWFEL